MNGAGQPTPQAKAVGQPRIVLSGGLWKVVGFLVFVEVVSGILQGYYTPIFTDIADHLGIREGDVNWFEAAQLMLSAIAVPLLCRMGDLWGHRRVLLLSTMITAAGSWILVFAPGFATFLVGWALQGAYIVWLPLEVAIIYQRTAGTGRQRRLTRRATGVLVAALQVGVVVGALTSGALVSATSFTVVLLLPAIAVTVGLVIIWWGVEDVRGTAAGSFDGIGLANLTVGLSLLMVGLVVFRIDGLMSLWPWMLLVLGALVLAFFARLQARIDEPLIDVKLMATRAQWPVQLAAFFFGMSVLGAQIPLSTFVRTNPAAAGYGLGADASFVSMLIGLYIVVAAGGALLLPLIARWRGVHGAIMLGLLLTSFGYGLFLFMHDTLVDAIINMAFVGVGSGLLVAALPVAAAEGAPPDRTGIATGMTNATKTVGGAFASAVFAIALSSTGSIADPGAGHAPLSGYLVVWSVCSASAFIAAALVGIALRSSRLESVTPGL